MPQIALIGAGVVGLTTALEIQARGHAVTIYAESLPGDDKSTRYTSQWAGANHVMIKGDDPRKREFERQTFERLWADSESGSEESRFLMRTERRIYYYQTDMADKSELEHMPGFRLLTNDELVGTATCGISFTTICIDIAAYLPFLLARFLSRGGRVRRTSVQHIDQVLLGSWGMPIPDALVVCPGLGARFLGGVEDRNMYPIRGQTVLIHAPWVKESRGMLDEMGNATVIIPRPSGDVFLGVTFDVEDWYPHPRTETGRAILERALMLMPELIPPNSRDPSSRPPTIADIEPLIIEHGCGLRPARKGGIRVESGAVIVGGAFGGKEVPVVYNYGHGAAGYQASWGTASAAAGLLEEVLAVAKDAV